MQPYMPFAIAGATAFWLYAQPIAMEWMIWTPCLAVIATVLHWPKVHDPALWVAAVCGACGLASFLVLLFRLIWHEGERRKVFLTMVLPAGLVPSYVLSAQNMLILAQMMHATTFDLYLYAFEGSLGVEPSFLAGRLLAASGILRETCLIVYLSLPFAMGIAYANTVDVKRGKTSWRLLILFVAAGLFGWMFYNLLPATGPRYAFTGQFPQFELPYASLKRLFLEPIAIAQSIPRNAIPSLHMTWVFLIAWNMRNISRVGRAVVLLYVLLTALGTLGLGEHYLIDLVVAYPFALMVQSVCSALSLRDTMRWIATSLGLALTLVWMLVLRHPKLFLAGRLIPWAAIILTLLATEFLGRKLARRLQTNDSSGLSADPSALVSPQPSNA